jgi:hypothetical protein
MPPLILITVTCRPRYGAHRTMSVTFSTVSVRRASSCHRGVRNERAEHTSRIGTAIDSPACRRRWPARIAASHP